MDTPSRMPLIWKPGWEFPRCLCGEEVAAPHRECEAMWIPPAAGESDRPADG